MKAKRIRGAWWISEQKSLLSPGSVTEPSSRSRAAAGHREAPRPLPRHRLRHPLRGRAAGAAPGWAGPARRCGLGFFFAVSGELRGANPTRPPAAGLYKN